MSRVLRARSSRSITACATALLIVCSAVPMFASGIVLGAQTFYRLLATPLSEQPNSPLPHPGVDVSLNPCPLPPGGADSTTFLDLTNPGSPLYFQPAVGYSQINWGIDFGAAGVQYSFPHGPQPDPVFNGQTQTWDFSFFAQATNGNSAPVGDLFQVSMQVGANAGDLVALNPCPLPPGSLGAGFEGMRNPIGFQFALPQNNVTDADPTLTFQLFNVTQGVGYVFAADSPVPEPATLLLTGGGLVFAHLWLRRRKRA